MLMASLIRARAAAEEVALAAAERSAASLQAASDAQDKAERAEAAAAAATATAATEAAAAAELRQAIAVLSQENEKVGAKPVKEKHEGIMRMASECMLIASLIR